MDKKKIDFWKQLKAVPAEAKKTIGAGRLKGMTDINPMWRIKVMNDTFGMCGFGWKYEITSQWLEPFGNEVKAFTNINMYVKVDGEWSEAIPATGGSSFVSMEKNGAYVSDEAHKMALTDALSVAMKAIGVGADVYWEKGADYGTKYEPRNAEAPKVETPKVEAPKTDDAQDLQKAFLKVTPDIMNAKNQTDLIYIWMRNEELQKFQPFKELMGKRKTEVPK